MGVRVADQEAEQQSSVEAKKDEKLFQLEFKKPGTETQMGKPVETQAAETVDPEGNQPKLTRLFPVVHLNPEEFENQERPRQESNLRHQL